MVDQPGNDADRQEKKGDNAKGKEQIHNRSFV